MTKEEKQEEEANYFARSILMPENEFAFDMWMLLKGDLSVRKDAIRILSKKYNAPEDQVIERIKDITIRYNA